MKSSASGAKKSGWMILVDMGGVCKIEEDGTG